MLCPAAQAFAITHVLNVSANCAQSPHVASRNFLRIPAVDNFGEQLLPHFATAFTFLGTVHRSTRQFISSILTRILDSSDTCTLYVQCTLYFYLYCTIRSTLIFRTVGQSSMSYTRRHHVSHTAKCRRVFESLYSNSACCPLIDECDYEYEYESESESERDSRNQMNAVCATRASDRVLVG